MDAAANVQNGQADGGLPAKPFQWPHQRANAPQSMEPKESRPPPVDQAEKSEPKPSLLSMLDNDYYDDKTAASGSSGTLPVISQLGNCSLTKAINENGLKLSAEESLVTITGEITASTTTNIAGESMDTGDGDDDEVIPATPPPPVAPVRLKSTHERQRKISDFLLRK